MASWKRLALKIALLVVPAVIASTLLGFGFAPMRAFFYRAFSSRGVVKTEGDITFDIPSHDWEPVIGFTLAMKDRLSRDHPFRDAIKPLTGNFTVALMSQDKFEDTTREQTGSTLPFNGGFFNPRLNRIEISVGRDEGPTPETYRALSHELTHAIMHYSTSSDAMWSPWLSEGFAQWCEVPDANSKIPVRDIGTLRAAGEFAEEGSLAALVAAGQGQFSQAGNARWYALSYALVTWLIDQHQAGFREYFREEARPGPLEPGTFERLVGAPADLEGPWLEWLRQQK